MQLNRKNKYLIFGVLAMSVVCYLFAIKNTLLLRQQLALSQEKAERHGNIQNRLSALTHKEQQLDLALTDLYLDNASVQNNLLDYINTQSLELKVNVLELNAPHISQGNNSTTTTQRLRIEGSYAAILKLINSLEFKGVFGRISHVDFEKTKNFRTRKTSLQASIYLETIQ
ncbi:hypothetical protein M3P19_15525 [Muricauda sp. 2012CJ35-5]|uniref:Uncharacterized protein n=1 Tax=Flagellimonas spongiicola TaxID=2942208 RepID=A0ABT0PVM0_9FLAO|nr:hypothetical protein [Allomuricauda spongiicola]MCL6275424.1 hypothetical protein [Allomuricauda spongiicola]